MSEREYILLDVFTTQRFQGNPLAVFTGASDLAPDTMQAIAAELNLSETVFLTSATDGVSVAHARIFSPRKELDFAGHPTIGTAHVLHSLGRASGSFSLQENVGGIRIETDLSDAEAPRFYLTTPSIAFAETLSPALCAQLLSLDAQDLAETPPQFLSAGSPLLFVHLRSKQAVDRAVLDKAVLPQALGSLNSGGTFIFASNPAPGRPYDVYARMFAPQIGIEEDPATGGATGPLAAYMMHYGLLPDAPEVQFTSEQGVKMGRRSVLYVRVRTTDGGREIQVGGTSVIVGRGSLYF